jgi:hypothetical protein
MILFVLRPHSLVGGYRVLCRRVARHVAGNVPSRTTFCLLSLFSSSNWSVSLLQTSEILLFFSFYWRYNFSVHSTYVFQYSYSCYVCFFCFLFCVFCVFVLFCVLFLLLYIAVSCLFLYKFTEQCHRVGKQLLQINIETYISTILL